ncbi:MAG: hypothetical protein EZS28_040020, partial [Streblomastix strix]
GVTYVEIGFGVNKQLNGLGPLTLTNIEFDKLQLLDVDNSRHYEIELVLISTQLLDQEGHIDIYFRDPDGFVSKEEGIQFIYQQTESSDCVKKEPVWNHHASMNAHYQREGG